MSDLPHIVVQDFEEYRSVFMDVAFWKQAIDYVAKQNNIRIDKIETGEPGSFPTFLINREYTFKFFGDLIFGQQCFAAELDVYAMLEHSRVRNVPRLHTWSYLFPDESTWRWPYIILDYIDGEPYGSVRKQLSANNTLQVAEDLARITQEIHSLPIIEGAFIAANWRWYANFMQQQAKKVIDNHSEWKSLPAHLVEQIPHYVGDVNDFFDTSNRASLVNADIHDAHVLGRYVSEQWVVTGIIDWGDAVVGDIYYELPALHLGTFKGDKSLLRRYLDAYQSPAYQADSFVKKAMVTTLLHEFDVLDDVAQEHDLNSFKCLEDIAAHLWQVY